MPTTPPDDFAIPENEGNNRMIVAVILGIILAAFVYWICLLAGLPFFIAVIAALLVLLACVAGGTGYGRRMP